MTTRRTSDSREPREREALYDETPATTTGPATGVADDGLARASAATGSWDPYDVWLTRVKKPRDQTMRMRKLEQRPDVQPAAEPDEPSKPDGSPEPSRA
jgi:hypothetical protein